MSRLNLAAIAQRSGRLYAARVAGLASDPWWTAIVITAGSQRQAERYRWELHRRETAGKIPADVRYVVVPDLGDQSTGTGGATLNALRALADVNWSAERVLIIHCGGDSRRLPQYSLSGKLFSVVLSVERHG